MEIRTENEKIVIVGGGICGLASALALHRKGIASIVLERSESLRATGAAIIMQPNGWRALDQLGVASTLRQTALSIQSGRYTSVKDGKDKDMPAGDVGELRCLKRSDLLNTLAKNLPEGTVRLGCKVVSIKLDPSTSHPILELDDGSLVKAKVVIGCDGLNSVVANLVGLNSTRLFSTTVIRGFTNYPNPNQPHQFGTSFLLFARDTVQLGLLPVTDKLVYWFLTRKLNSQDSMIAKSGRLIKESSVEAMKGFPDHIKEMVAECDEESLHLADLKYRPPWDVLRRNLRKGCVTVAGDAMHAMAPFLAQGGSASLEDAVVLARCLSRHQMIVRRKRQPQHMGNHNHNHNEEEEEEEEEEVKLVVDVEKALDEYGRERRMRVFWLMFETFLIGTMLDTSRLLSKAMCILALILLFRDRIGHTRYNCGPL